jgi:hypothetical protein
MRRRDGEEIGADQLSNAWSAFVGRIKWDVMVTLTFDPKRRFPVGRELANEEAFWWVGLVGKLFRLPVRWLYASERGRGGAWHTHVLLADVENRRWHAPLAAWEERNGFTDLTHLHDRAGVVLYVTKSAAGRGDVIISDTLYRHRSELLTEPPIGLEVKLP